MTWDHFAYLSQQDDIEAIPLPWGYVSGWIDRLSTKVFALEIERALAEEQGDKDRAKVLRKQIVEIQKAYRRHATKQIPVRCFPFAVTDFCSLPSPHWLGLQVDFELLTPWYSKDDRIFHVMDNAVRKDRVFGVPIMAASSWKGMLRWACRMQAGLLAFLEAGKSFEKEWRDPDWILHLFGNEKGEEKDFHQGALIFYPTWFNKISFEVINPHRRATRAGRQPIYYEVVPGQRVKKNQDGSEEEVEGAKGTLWLLYAPWPGMKPKPKPADVLPKLLEAIEALLITYGISAKRTVGWGTAEIIAWRAFHKEHGTETESQRENLWQKIQNWLPEGGTP